MWLLLAASLLWAFSFGLIKGQLSAYDPVLVAAGRLLLAALVFVPLLARGRPGRGIATRAAALGVLQFGLMYVLYIASFAWLAAWQVAALTVFTPLYVVGLSALARGAVGWRHAAAALLAVGGALLVTGAVPGGVDWRGVVLLQGANLCFAAGQLGYRRLQVRAAGQDGVLIGWMYAGAAAVTVAAALLRDPAGLGAVRDWPGPATASLLYLGLLPTGLGFYLWNRGAARTGPGPLAVANNLKVPLAVIVSWLVFGEQAPYLRVLAGLAVIVAGLALAAPRPGRT